ncbi:hypothetical protein KEM55_009060, partial [Ascosphaera atra]
TPLPALPSLRSATDLVEVPEQAFNAFSNTLQKVGLRIKLVSIQSDVASDPAVTGQAAPTLLEKSGPRHPPEPKGLRHPVHVERSKATVSFSPPPRSPEYAESEDDSIERYMDLLFELEDEGEEEGHAGAPDNTASATTSGPTSKGDTDLQHRRGSASTRQLSGEGPGLAP